MYIYTTFYLTIKGNFIRKLLHIRLQNYYTTDIIIMMLMESGSKSKAYCLPGYIVHLFVLCHSTGAGRVVDLAESARDDFTEGRVRMGGPDYPIKTPDGQSCE